MNTPTIIHIGTFNLHVPSPGVLLSSDSTPRPALADQCAGIVQPAGTVIDQATGLMWGKSTSAKNQTWAEAKAAAEGVRLGGYTDWRLPTRAELLTLVDDTRSNPAIDIDRFDCESDWYWTSTPLASSPSDCAWGVNFNYGDAFYIHQSLNGRVRAVRAVSSPASGQ